MSEKHHYKGLTDAQVVESRQKYGENTFLVALVFSFGVSFYEYTVHDTGIHAFLEPVGILFAILLATGVAFYFEQKANKQFEILNQVNDDIYYKVIRNERITQVLKKDIVVGDIVIIKCLPTGSCLRRYPYT